MIQFGTAAVIGLFVGFLWGTGCSLAIMYSIYLSGYRKAVEDSLAEGQSKRWRETLKRVEAKRAKEAAIAAKESPAETK
jgi:hypothetical protein